MLRTLLREQCRPGLLRIPACRFATMAETRKLPLLINGREIYDGKTFTVPDPFDPSRSLNEVVSADESTVETVCTAALDAFQIWRKASVAERREVLLRAADLLEQRREKFKSLLQTHGLPKWFHGIDLDGSIQHIREVAYVLNDEGTVAANDGAQIRLIVRDPMGPVLSIAPWNAPTILSVRAMVSPLAAGCSVILKTSELAAEIHYEAARVFVDAGVPEGAVSVVHVDPSLAPKIVPALIAHNSIRKVTFTGSTNVGRIIAEQAGRNLKPVLLELGGKSAVIVDKDADLVKAAAVAVQFSWAHKGQICMATERVFVHKDVADEYRKLVATAAESLAKDPDMAIPQRTPQFADKIEKLIKSATDKGAKLIYGNGTRDNSAITPTLLEGVDPSMEIHDTETFGPVSYFSVVDSAEEAIEIINRGKYGLSTSIFCQNPVRAVNLARSVESGAVHINSPTVHDEADIPHGGVKESGFGRFNSKWGISEFSYVKTITMV